jgi:hypothetical protein
MMTTGQKNFVAIALFVTLFAALLLGSGCSSTLLKSTVDYRALRVAEEAIEQYDKQLNARIESELSHCLDEKVSSAVKSEVGGMVVRVLPWGLATLFGGGGALAIAKRKGIKLPGSNGDV